MEKSKILSTGSRVGNLRKETCYFVCIISIFLLCGVPTSSQSNPPLKKIRKINLTDVSKDQADTLGCLSCHEGIEDIRDKESSMMVMITDMGEQYGDPGGCVICHGGNPKALTYQDAHQGAPKDMETGPKTFYPDPGSLFIAQYTCGQCHIDHVYSLKRALMNTEAGKIQGNLHTWGIDDVQYYRVPWGNYDVEDTDGTVPLVGTSTYKNYMSRMIAKFPKQFPQKLKKIPSPSVSEIEKDPKLAGFTYQRQQCQRCHVSVRGREKRGDYRGMGCSSCHMIYGNEGIYEGSDPTIDKKEKGHLLTHKMHGTGKDGNGIPVETCNSCHNRGKRIGVTYQGLMEFSYGSPYGKDGETQPKLHTKKYLYISDDLHHQNESRQGNPKGGLLCQDCHTTIDVHGDGNIFGTTLAQVEIECQDCHGTVDKYPWELPIGYGEEFGEKLGTKERGLAEILLSVTDDFATTYPKKDGYLLTARGNPFGNVIKDGTKVYLHSATGNEFEVPVLKQINIEKRWKSENAMVAMSQIKKHQERLECYACHASWVPQCYGCHVKVDYSKGMDGKPKTDIDWVASANKNYPDGQTAESRLGTGGIRSEGKVYETRSYLRWEEPVLGINGEGRVTPLMPGCQVVFTVIGRDGKILTLNQTSKSVDEADAINQKHVPSGVDMAPVQPHSAQRKARTCESCHNNPKAMGYGISGGVFVTRQAEDIVEDLINQKTGQLIPKNHKIQIPAIPGIDFDWSTIINEQGDQVQTVGTHWPLSRALNREEREGMKRTGLCIGCHKEMTNNEVWGAVSTPGTLNDNQHMELMNKLLKNYYNSKKSDQ